MDALKDYSYKKWKNEVNKYTNNIVKKNTEDMYDIDYRSLYNRKYHPYLTAVIAVLQSKEYKKGEIYESFIIPTDKMIFLIKK